MARRLTTNQEIPGSTPGVITLFACLDQETGNLFWFARRIFLVGLEKHRPRCRLHLPPKFCPLLQLLQGTISHCAYQYSINRPQGSLLILDTVQVGL